MNKKTLLQNFGDLYNKQPIVSSLSIYFWCFAWKLKQFHRKLRNVLPFLRSYCTDKKATIYHICIYIKKYCYIIYKKIPNEPIVCSIDLNWHWKVLCDEIFMMAMYMTSWILVSDFVRITLILSLLIAKKSSNFQQQKLKFEKLKFLMYNV